MTEQRLALSKAEFALAIGTSEKSVDRRVRAGEIKVIRIGRLVRIPRAEIERLMSDGTAPV